MPTTLKKQSDVSVDSPDVDQLRLFAGDDGFVKIKDNTGAVRFIGDYPTFLTNTVVGPGSYTAAIGELIPVDVSAGAVTIDLPPVADSIDKKVTVKLTSIATYACTIDADGTELIDNALTLVLSGNREWATLFCDGTQWMQIG